MDEQNQNKGKKKNKKTIFLSPELFFVIPLEGKKDELIEVKIKVIYGTGSSSLMYKLTLINS